jgi:hypothetical protein
MRAVNITGETGTLNTQAKSAARSAFESAKQRFFGHLLTSMKTPSLIRSIERDLDAGHAAVIQIVSTGEALMERRLAEIPTEEWSDVQVDITPREYVLDYLAHSFPVQVCEPFTDSEGNLSSRPVYRDGQPVESWEAVKRRDRLIEKLASLPPVPGALDQIVQRFARTWSPRSRDALAASSATAAASSLRTVPHRQTSQRPLPSWMTPSASLSSAMPAAQDVRGEEKPASGETKAGLKVCFWVLGIMGRRRARSR